MTNRCVSVFLFYFSIVWLVALPAFASQETLQKTFCENELTGVGSPHASQFIRLLNAYLTNSTQARAIAARILSAPQAMNPVTAANSAAEAQFQNAFATLVSKISASDWTSIQASAALWSKNQVTIENDRHTRSKETRIITKIKELSRIEVPFEATPQAVTIDDTSYVLIRYRDKLQVYAIDLKTGQHEFIDSVHMDIISNNVPTLFASRAGKIYVTYPDGNNVLLFRMESGNKSVQLPDTKLSNSPFVLSRQVAPNGNTVILTRSGAFLRFLEFDENTESFVVSSKIPIQTEIRAEEYWFKVGEKTYFLSQNHKHAIILYEVVSGARTHYQEIGTLISSRPLSDKFLLHHSVVSFVRDGHTFLSFNTSGNEPVRTQLHVVDLGRVITTKRTLFGKKRVVMKEYVAPIETPRYVPHTVVQKNGRDFIITSATAHLQVTEFTSDHRLVDHFQIATGLVPKYITTNVDSDNRDFIAIVDTNQMGYYELTSDGQLQLADFYGPLKPNRFRGHHGPLFLKGKTNTFIAIGNLYLGILSTRQNVSEND